MNRILKTTLIVIAILLVAGGSLVAGWLVGNRTQATTTTSTTSGGTYGFGPGMMVGGFRSGERGYDNRRGGMMGGKVMDGPGYWSGSETNLTPLTIDQATQAAEKYLSSLGISDLKIAEVMIFDNNAYVRVIEQSTGIGAFELLVDPATQAAYPEYGANMMWNLKYGGLNHRYKMGGRGGMMGGFVWSTTPADVSAEMTVSAQQALETAQKYLDTHQPGVTTAVDADPFYGYYTIDTLRDGKIVGMLSVNGVNAQVFLHTWHGNFIEMSEE